jgi:hypothetical protein
MDFLKNIFASTPVVEGGLTLMIAGWLGYQLRSIPSRLYQFVRHWTTREVEIRETSPLYEAWLEMLTQGAVRPGGPRTLEVRAVTGDDDKTRSTYKAGADTFWARVCGKWCRVFVGREGGSMGAGGAADLMRRFIINVEVVLATRADLARMLAEVRRRATVAEDRQVVEFCDKWGSRHTLKLPRREARTLCLPAGLYEDVETRVREFLAARDHYERAGIPWRFGILLHGLPGTGKTSLVHVLASRLKLRLAVVPLADLRTDEELVSAFTAIGDDAIVLIEDVDCAFRHRDAEDVDGITFSGFLNCIDGMLAPQNGRVLVMTTNHVDRLDPALIRPGRVDLKIQAPLLTRDAASDYVDRLFPHVSTRHDIVTEVMATQAPTPAALLNRIMREPWQRATTAPPRARPEPAALDHNDPHAGQTRGVQARAQGGES